MHRHEANRAAGRHRPLSCLCSRAVTHAPEESRSLKRRIHVTDGPSGLGSQRGLAPPLDAERNSAGPPATRAACPPLSSIIDAVSTAWSPAVAAGVLTLAGALLPAAPALGQATGLWYGEGVEPLPSGTVSAVVLRDEEPIYSEPSAKSPRRGTAIRAARLPLFGARLGPGCAKRWLFVGPNAWICEDGATPSSQPPLALDAPVEATPLGLPHRYFFVSKEGSFGYRELETAEAGAPDVQYQPGFGVAITRVSPKKETGDPFGLTSRGFWVPMREQTPPVVGGLKE